MEMGYILYDKHINAYFTNFGVTLMLQNGPMDKVVFFYSSGFIAVTQKNKQKTNQLLIFTFYDKSWSQVGEFSKAHKFDLILCYCSLHFRSKFKSDIFIGLRFINYYLHICSNYY